MSSTEKPGGSQRGSDSPDSGRGAGHIPCWRCWIYMSGKPALCCSDIMAGGDGSAQCDLCKHLEKFCLISKEPCFPGLKEDTPPKGFEEMLSGLEQQPSDPAAIQEAQRIFREVLRGGLCYLGKLAKDALSKGIVDTDVRGGFGTTHLAEMWADMAAGVTGEL